MKQMTELDYVKFYAEKIKEDNTLFNQQRKFINAQIKGSSSLFKKKFIKDFKSEAREYLKGIGLI